jgi:hypothetical protein
MKAEREREREREEREKLRLQACNLVMWKEQRFQMKAVL